MGRISVIVPIFNVEKYLDACIKSICNQTYRDLEIILIDDGSTDRSGDICEEWSHKDERVIVFHQENKGLSYARNYGLEKSTGNYVGFVDSDDYLEPEMYEKLINRIINDRSQIAFCAYRAIDENGQECRRVYEDFPDSVLKKEEFFCKLYSNERTRCSFAVVWNKLFRKDIVFDERFLPIRVHEDEFFINAVVKNADRISVINKPYYNYVQRKNSIIHNCLKTESLPLLFEANMERLTIGRENSFSYESLKIIARECVETGIKAWVVARKDSNDIEKCKDIYFRVSRVIMEYKTFEPLGKRVKVFSFLYFPCLLRLAYLIKEGKD